MTDKVKCEVCDRVATRVMDGHDCCSEHSHLDLNPSPPVVLCGLPGCDQPADRGSILTASPFCRYHAEFVRSRAA
jgi:hypothetical protein